MKTKMITQISIALMIGTLFASNSLANDKDAWERQQASYCESKINMTAKYLKRAKEHYENKKLPKMNYLFAKLLHLDAVYVCKKITVEKFCENAVPVAADLMQEADKSLAIGKLKSAAYYQLQTFKHFKVDRICKDKN